MRPSVICVSLVILALAVASPIIVQTDDLVPEEHQPAVPGESEFVQENKPAGSWLERIFNPANWFSDGGVKKTPTPKAPKHTQTMLATTTMEMPPPIKKSAKHAAKAAAQSTTKAAKKPAVKKYVRKVSKKHSKRVHMATQAIVEAAVSASTSGWGVLGPIAAKHTKAALKHTQAVKHTAKAPTVVNTANAEKALEDAEVGEFMLSVQPADKTATADHSAAHLGSWKAAALKMQQIMMKLKIATAKMRSRKMVDATAKGKYSLLQSAKVAILVSKEEAESLRSAVQKHDVEEARTLVDGGINVNAKLDAEGHTAVMLAVKNGDEKMIDTLMILGASVLIHDIHGKIPLDYCHSNPSMKPMSLFGFLNPAKWFSSPPPPPAITELGKGVANFVKKDAHTMTEDSLDNVQKKAVTQTASALKHAHVQLKQAKMTGKDTTVITKTPQTVASSQIKDVHGKEAKTIHAATDQAINKAVAAGKKAIETAKSDLTAADDETATDKAISAELKHLDDEQFPKKISTTSTSDQVNNNVMKDVNDLDHMFTPPGAESSNSP